MLCKKFRAGALEVQVAVDAATAAAATTSGALLAPRWLVELSNGGLADDACHLSGKPKSRESAGVVLLFSSVTRRAWFSLLRRTNVDVAATTGSNDVPGNTSKHIAAAAACLSVTETCW
jgi:hypothetical protein